MFEVRNRMFGVLRTTWYFSCSKFEVKQIDTEGEKARQSAQSEQINEEQSHHSMRLIQISQAQSTNVEPASTFKLSLTGSLHIWT